MPKQVAALLPCISIRTVDPPTLLPSQPAPRRAAAQPFATISAATRPPITHSTPAAQPPTAGSTCGTTASNPPPTTATHSPATWATAFAAAAAPFASVTTACASTPAGM